MIEAIVEVLARLVVEPLVEIVLRIPGYLIIRCFLPRESIDTEGPQITMLGFGFWVVTALLIWGAVVFW